MPRLMSFGPDIVPYMSVNPLKIRRTLTGNSKGEMILMGPRWDFFFISIYRLPDRNRIVKIGLLAAVRDLLVLRAVVMGPREMGLGMAVSRDHNILGFTSFGSCINERT